MKPATRRDCPVLFRDISTRNAFIWDWGKERSGGTVTVAPLLFTFHIHHVEASPGGPWQDVLSSRYLFFFRLADCGL